MTLHPRPTASRVPFTLVELLVVVAIIAVLAGLLLPVLAQAREKARRSSCISQLKEQAIAIQLYAQGNDDFVPMFDNDPRINLWDETGDFYSQLMENSGMVPKQFCCPSNPNFGGALNWTETPGTLGWTSYEFIIDHTPHTVLNKFADTTLSTAQFISRITHVADASRAVVVTDVAEDSPFVYSNHRDGADVTLGGNSAYVDSHAEWRAARDMEPQFTNVYGINDLF